MDIQIEDNVPLPARRWPSKGFTAAIEKLNVGQSCRLDATLESANGIAWRVGKRLGRTYRVRFVGTRTNPYQTGVRVWRIA